MRSLFQTCKILWLSKSLPSPPPSLFSDLASLTSGLPFPSSSSCHSSTSGLSSSSSSSFSTGCLTAHHRSPPPPLPVRTSLWVSKKSGGGSRHRQRPIHWRPRNVEGRREGRSSSHPLLLFLAMDIEEKGSKDSPNAASGLQEKAQIRIF